MNNTKRCLGYTLCGKRCKKTTSDPQGRCPQHKESQPLCQPLQEPVYQCNNNLPTYDVHARIQLGGEYSRSRRNSRRKSTRRVSFVEHEETQPLEEPVYQYNNDLPTYDVDARIQLGEYRTRRSRRVLDHENPIEMTNEELENEAILCLAKEAAKRGALVIMYRE